MQSKSGEAITDPDEFFQLILSQSFDITKQLFDELVEEKQKEFIDLIDDGGNILECKEDAEKWMADNDEEEGFFE